MASPFPAELSELNFSEVDFYDFSQWLFETYNEQIIFEPLKEAIQPKDYIHFVKYFPEHKNLLPLVNAEFCEFFIIQVLYQNGFKTEEDYLGGREKLFKKLFKDV